MPKISIIIPVYNVKKYLSTCLDSILNQTFTDWEAICVNDGSTDGSEAVLYHYAQIDSRIKIVTQINQGASMARNNGLKQGLGDYIYFLDSDDYIHPQCLEIAYSFAEEYNADLVSFSFYEEGKEKFNSDCIDVRRISMKITSNPILLGTTYKKKFSIFFNPWTKLYKRELLNGITFIPNNYIEDVPHTFAVLAKKPKTVVIDAKLYFYTRNPNSVSFRNANPKQIQDYHEGINYIYEIYKKPIFTKELKFLKRNFLPNIFKQQLHKCRRAPEEIRDKMFKAFAFELQDLNKKNLISWRGHRLARYIQYRKLIFQEETKDI